MECFFFNVLLIMSSCIIFYDHYDIRYIEKSLFGCLEVWIVIINSQKQKKREKDLRTIRNVENESHIVVYIFYFFLNQKR